MAHAQIKAGNNSESLLNEIRQIIYSLYQSKEISKNAYNNITKSTKSIIQNGYNLINSKNGIASEYHVLVLKKCCFIKF